MPTPNKPRIADPFDGRKWFEAKLYARPQRVDREHGAILGCSIVTAGPALGHGVSLDAEFVERVVELGNAERGGLKARFGHPNMCSTALGTFLGRWKSFSRIGGKALADLYLSNSAHATPQGDLYEYVCTLAVDEPDMFGTSIVFTRGRTYRRAADGSKVIHPYDLDDGSLSDDDFRKARRQYEDTPGPDYVECAELHAADVVDEPAANPGGLFSRWTNETLAGQVTQFLDTHPEVMDILTAHPDVVAEFREKYEAHKERRNQGAIPMAEKPAAAPAAPATQPAEPAAPAAESAPAAMSAAAAPAAAAEPEPAAEPAATTLGTSAEPETPAAVEAEPGPAMFAVAELARLRDLYGADIACAAVVSGNGEVEALRLALEKERQENAALKAGRPAPFADGPGKGGATGPAKMFPHLK